MKKTRILILIALALASLTIRLVPVATAAQLDTWTWHNPLPTGNHLNSVTHGIINGNGLFAAVGVNGTIITSSNGVNWNQPVTLAPNASLSDVAFSSSLNMFVAVGADAATPPDNIILTSTDGINWVPNAQSGGIGTGGLLAVACDGSGDFMAVGNNGVNLYSSGGMMWTLKNVITTGVDFDGVAYDGNITFVAVGANSSIYYSTTGGNSWTASTVNGSNGDSFQAIAHGNGTFVAVGDFLGYFYSLDDGKTFNQATSISTYPNSTYGDSVIYADSEFIVANTLTYYPSILTSADGINWEAYAEPPWLFAAIAYDGNGTFVGVGSGIATNLTDVTEADDWGSVVTSCSSGDFNAIAYGTTAALPGDNFFVAGGAGTGQTPVVVWSADGFTWLLDTDPSIYNNYSQLYNSFITGLAYGAVENNSPAFVATVNTYSGSSGHASVILSSTNFSLDGPVWVPVYTNQPNVMNGITCGQNSSGQSLFVAVGNGGTVISSTNPSVPSSWTPAMNPPSSSQLNAVAYGGGSFIAAGMYGDIFYSSDGGANSWNPAILIPEDASDTFNSVAYGNGVFVAVGYYESTDFTEVGVIYTSSNGGVYFTQPTATFTPPTTAPPPFTGITFANGLFVAVTGNNGNGSAIFVSKDGVNWTQSSAAPPNSLNAVASGDYQYIAVGGSGVILGSVLDAVAGGHFLSSGGSSGIFSFSAYGPPGTTYGVYVSNDLVTWTWLKNITIAYGSASAPVTDDTSVNYSNGYYYLGPPGPPP